MGRAKLKHTHTHTHTHTRDVAASKRAAQPEVAHDDRVAEAILDMALDYDDGNPVAGIRNALIAGVAFWMILAFGAWLLV